MNEAVAKKGQRDCDGQIEGTRRGEQTDAPTWRLVRVSKMDHRSSPLGDPWRSSAMNAMLRFLSLFAFLCVAGCFDAEAPSNPLVALRNATTFQLHSLDPTNSPVSADRWPPPKTRFFHSYRILGSTQIVDPNVQTKLVTVLETGIAEYDGLVVRCFIPRHGIHIDDGNHVYDFVICFECRQIVCYVDGVDTETIPVNESPQPTFDRVLSNASIALASPAK